MRRFARAALLAGGLSLTASHAAALEVVGAEPPLGTAAAASAPIVLRFDVPVNPASVSAQRFHAAGRWSGPIPGSITIGEQGRALALQPSRPVPAGDDVLVYASEELADLAGGTLPAGGYSWEYRVRTERGPVALEPWTSFSAGSPEGEGDLRVYGGASMDLDRDGWLDLAVVNEGGADVRVFMNLGHGLGLSESFLEPVNEIGLGASPNEPGDFDGDGFPDLVVANRFSPSLSILFGGGDGTFAPEVSIPLEDEVKAVVTLDADGDADIDLAATHRFTREILLFINDGDGNFSRGTTLSVGQSLDWINGMIAADLDGDGITDLAVATASAKIFVFLGRGDGTYFEVYNGGAGGNVWTLSKGDVDGDHDIDLATASRDDDYATILLNDGDGTFAAPVVYESSPRPVATDLGDLDGDGDLDWVVSAFGGQRWQVMLNDGSGNFDLHQEILAPENPACAVLSELDNDGDLDVLLFDEIGGDVIVLRNRSTDPALFVDDFESGGVDGWSTCAGPGCPSP